MSVGNGQALLHSWVPGMGCLWACCWAFFAKRKLGQRPWAAKFDVGLSIDAWVDIGRGCCGAAFGLVGHSSQGFLVRARA